jgi:hypothetical protein
MMADRGGGALFGTGTALVLIVTTVGIIGYWAVVLSGAVTIPEPVPGYTAWFMAFPVADMWIALAALVSLACNRREARIARGFLAATGSALIFLGLNAFAYGYQTGLLTTLSPGEIIEIAIKIYCLTIGSLLVATSCRRPEPPRA